MNQNPIIRRRLAPPRTPGRSPPNPGDWRRRWWSEFWAKRALRRDLGPVSIVRSQRHHHGVHPRLRQQRAQRPFEDGGAQQRRILLGSRPREPTRRSAHRGPRRERWPRRAALLGQASFRASGDGGRGRGGSGRCRRHDLVKGFAVADHAQLAAGALFERGQTHFAGQSLPRPIADCDQLARGWPRLAARRQPADAIPRVFLDPRARADIAARPSARPKTAAKILMGTGA